MQTHESVGFKRCHMGQLIKIDFALARKYRELIKDSFALHDEGMALNIVQVVEQIREDGVFDPKLFAPEKGFMYDGPDTEPMVIEAHFGPDPEVVDMYRDAMIKLAESSLDPDELELRLLRLMARAKRDGVDLNALV